MYWEISLKQRRKNQINEEKHMLEVNSIISPQNRKIEMKIGSVYNSMSVKNNLFFLKFFPMRTLQSNEGNPHLHPLVNTAMICIVLFLIIYGYWNYAYS